MDALQAFYLAIVLGILPPAVFVAYMAHKQRPEDEAAEAGETDPNRTAAE